MKRELLGSTGVLAAVVLLGGGCAVDFTEAWEVTEPRPYGSRVSIEGDDQGRTRARPGESITVERYFISPGRPQRSYAVDIIGCVGVRLPDGQPQCFMQFDFPGLVIEPYQGDDRIVMTGLTVPPEVADLPAELVDRFHFFGAACVDGQVERVAGKNVRDDPVVDVFRCTDNEASPYPDLMTYIGSILLDRGDPGQLNHHPRFECDEDAGSACTAGVARAGEPRVPGPFVLVRPGGDGEAQIEAWPAWDEEAQGPLPWSGCRDAEGLLQVRQGAGEHRIRVRFDPSDRETYQEQPEGTLDEPITRREDLVVSHAITTRGGELSAQKSLLDRELEDDEAEIELTYTPPKAGEDADGRASEDGRLVRLYLAVRDLRGGYDFTTRELCLLPP